MTGGRTRQGGRGPALLDEGAVPAVVDRDEVGGVPLFAVRAELTETAECRRAVAEVRVARFGRMDGLVNERGRERRRRAGGRRPRACLLSLRRNLTHYYEMAHFALPELLKSPGRDRQHRVQGGRDRTGGTSAYAAANGGRNALTREWAAELAKDGVRVNAVIVAECWTPMYAGWLRSAARPRGGRGSGSRAESPLGRAHDQPRGDRDTVVFLLSPLRAHDRAAVHVDGGYVHLDRARDE